MKSNENSSEMSIKYEDKKLINISIDVNIPESGKPFTGQLAGPLSTARCPGKDRPNKGQIYARPTSNNTANKTTNRKPID